MGLPWQLTSDTTTVGQWDFGGGLDPNWNMTVHPKIDPVTGELRFFGYDFGPTNLRYHRVDADGTLVQTEGIATKGPTMMHDFNITDPGRAVDLPVVFDLDLLVDGMTMPFRWDTTTTAHGSARDAAGGSDDVQWIEIDPCYVFHPLTRRRRRSHRDRRLPLDRMFATSHIGPEEPTWAAGRAGRSIRHRLRARGTAQRQTPSSSPGSTIARRPAPHRRVGRPHEGGLHGRGAPAYDLDRGTTQTWIRPQRRTQ